MVATSYHPAILKDIDELLARDAFHQSTAGDHFYLNIFVIPKWDGGLWHIHNNKWFSQNLHIPTFKMP